MVNKFKIIRVTAGKTQAEMARDIGTSMRMLNEAERTGKASRTTIKKYAAATGIPLGVLLNMDLDGKSHTEAVQYVSTLMVAFGKKGEKNAYSRDSLTAGGDPRKEGSDDLSAAHDAVPETVLRHALAAQDAEPEGY